MDKKIFIDGVIFQTQKNRPAGISRVWNSLLNELSKSSLADKIILLDRGGSLPDSHSMKKIIINNYLQDSFESDPMYLQHIINENGNGLFISSYYTYPENSPCVTILHDMTPEAMSLNLNHAEWMAKQKAIEKSSAFFAVSEATKKDFFKYYPQYSSKPVTVIHNAVSNEFNTLSKWEKRLFNKVYNIKKPYFIFSGHRIGYKNAISFLKAFNLLENKKDYELFFTGGSAEIEKVFLKYLDGIKYQVQFLTDRELSVAYNGAEALIYPSLYEGFGLPVLEAMSVGCPVIAGNNSSIPEVAGDSALLIDVKNITELKEALVKVQDSALRKNLIQKGYKNIKRFSWEKTGEVFTQTLEHLLNNFESLQFNKTEDINSWERYLFTFYNKTHLNKLLNAYSNSIRCFEKQDNSFNFSELAETERKIAQLITDDEFEQLLSACKISSNDYFLNYWCGIVLQASNRLEEALEHYLKLSKVKLPNNRVPFLAADLAYRLGKKTTAENLYKFLCKENEKYAEGIARLKELTAYSSKIRESMEKKRIDLSLYPECKVKDEKEISDSLISIILPTRDRNEGVEEVLESIPAAMFKLNYEIILITGKKSLTELQPVIKKHNVTKVFFDEEIFAPGEKFNWAKLMNYGIKNSGGNWIVYASDDIEFFPFSFWNAFHSLNIKDETGGITFLHKNNVETYGGIFDNYGYDQVAQFPYINFGVVNRKAFEKVNGFDENFKFYWADADLCMRIWEAGYKIEISPYSLVDHNNIADRLKQENSGDRYFSDTYNFYSKWNKRKLLKENQILLKKRVYFHEDDLGKVLKIISDQMNNYPSVKNSVNSYLTEKIEKFLESSGQKPAEEQNDIIVSAIVSTYNSEKYIKGCLDDLINQTLYKKGKLEIIVVNSGSQQNEEEIIKEYQLKYQNIKYLKTEREPIYKAWNRGIKSASGKYITNANTDDRHRYDALEIMSEILNDDENTGLVYADQYVTYKENQQFENHEAAGFFEWPEFDRVQLIHCAICGPQPMWRKNLHEKYGYFDESLIVAGDYEWWLRISDKVKFKHIPEKLGLYLLSDDSIEHRNSHQMNNETLILRSKYAEKENIKLLDYQNYRSTFLKFNDEEDLLFSVIIISYNRPKQLLEAVKSVIIQTVQNFEIIIVNDGGKKINSKEKILNDKRVKIFNKNLNEGPAAARNLGIKNSSGKYIAFLDDDDIFYADHLETALFHLRKGNKVVYSDASRFTYKKIKNDYKLINKAVPYSVDYERNKLLLANISPVNCFVFEKELLKKSGLFNEEFKVLEDWEFWLRLSKTSDFFHIKKTTVQVNWKDDGSTITSSKQKDFQKFRDEIYNSYANEIRDIQNKEEIMSEFQNIWMNDSLNTPVVSIIVPTFNQLEYTKGFLDSVFLHTKIPVELIIIVNNKNDGTIEYIKQLRNSYPYIKTIINEENVGFPASINQGIRTASTDFILIINNDVIVTDGWLETLIDTANNNPQTGIVGPISNSVSGIQFDKNAKYNSIEEMHKYAAKISRENKGKILSFPRVAFLCTLIKKEVIEKIGGLDERFSPGNFEDDDFCLRAQLAGFKTVIAHDVFIHHYGSKSFKADGEDKYAERLKINRQKFVDKWGADPDEIWIKGKSIKSNDIFIPLYENSEENDDLSVKLFDLSVKQFEAGEYAAAGETIKELLKNYEDKDSRNTKFKIEDILDFAGRISLLNNDKKSAQKYFEEELKQNPESSNACAGLGEVFYLSGIPESAKVMFEWAVNNNPSNKTAVQRLEMINLNLGLPADHSSLSDEASANSGFIRNTV